MVRSHWIQALAFVLAVAGSSWGQAPASRPAARTAKRALFLNVEEQGRKAQRCQVLRFWRKPDGYHGYLVQAQDTGELLTLLEEGQVSRIEGPKQSHFRAVSTAIYRHGFAGAPPQGTPLPPEDAVVVGSPRAYAVRTSAKPKSTSVKRQGVVVSQQTKPVSTPIKRTSPISTTPPTRKPVVQKPVGKPTPKVVGNPTPSVGEKPTPKVVGKPTPNVVRKPTPSVGEKPTPKVVGNPTPSVGEKPTPKVASIPTIPPTTKEEQMGQQAKSPEKEFSAKKDDGSDWRKSWGELPKGSFDTSESKEHRQVSRTNPAPLPKLPELPEPKALRQNDPLANPEKYSTNPTLVEVEKTELPRTNATLAKETPIPTTPTTKSDEGPTLDVVTKPAPAPLPKVDPTPIKPVSTVPPVVSTEPVVKSSEPSATTPPVVNTAPVDLPKQPETPTPAEGTLEPTTPTVPLGTGSMAAAGKAGEEASQEAQHPPTSIPADAPNAFSPRRPRNPQQPTARPNAFSRASPAPQQTGHANAWHNGTPSPVMTPDPRMMQAMMSDPRMAQMMTDPRMRQAMMSDPRMAQMMMARAMAQPNMQPGAANAFTKAASTRPIPADFGSYNAGPNAFGASGPATTGTTIPVMRGTPSAVMVPGGIIRGTPNPMATPGSVGMPVDIQQTTYVPGTKSFEELQAILKDALLPSEREWAVEDLGNFGHSNQPATVATLLQTAKTDPAASVRTAAIQALVKLKASSNEVLATLAELQKDKDEHVRQVATAAYKSLTLAAKRRSW